MYDELIKQLRDNNHHLDCEMCDRDCCYPGRRDLGKCIILQAADAIEELSKAQEQWIKQERKALLKSVPKWIPVTERLPEAYEDVLLLFPNNQAAGFRDRDGYWGVYSGNGFYTKVAEYETKPTHWAKKLSQPPKEDA